MREAALLIHGFTGTPAELKDLGSAIGSTLGWEVSVPLLPGHGTTTDDLARTKAVDWLEAVETARANLESRVPRVHLLGLSMGALLILESFRNRPKRVASLVLLAPPLWLRSWKENLVANVFPKIPFLRDRCLPKNPADQTPGHVSYDGFPVAAVGAFFTLSKRARSLATINSVPALTVYSEADSAVHPRSAFFLNSRFTHPKSRLVRLERSTHILPLSVEKACLSEEILSFYRGITSPF
ncbi:MAG: alpha/beta fold hydrolase [Pseudomonadota bacterium]